MRSEFWEADLRGANFDRTTLTKTSFARADLRGSSFRGARFDRTSLNDATLGDLDAGGASGTILPGPASIGTPDGLHGANEDEVLAYLRAAGAGRIVLGTAQAPPGHIEGSVDAAKAQARSTKEHAAEQATTEHGWLITRRSQVQSPPRHQSRCRAGSRGTALLFRSAHAELPDRPGGRTTRRRRP